MFFLLPNGLARPSILETNKDAEYHIKFARYCLGQANNFMHQEWLEKIQRNKRFYKGDQWTFNEDIDTFLKDDDNQDRNRLKIALNVIRPIVEQYRGNAIRMNINFRVKSISPRAINRRETKMAEMQHLTRVANQQDNPFGPGLKKKFPIGDNAGETETMVNNTYVDGYVEDMNGLVKFVSERNKFANKQVMVAMNTAFTGLGVMEDFEYAGHQQFRVVPSETFFWDRSAKEPDLTDASFMGDVQEMFPSEIFERYPDISDGDRENIENWSKFYSGVGGNYLPASENSTRMPSGKVPVFKVYWQDGQKDDFGYVRDQYGYEYLTKINYIYEGEDKPRYTQADVIAPTSIRGKKLFKDKKQRKLYYDTLRMAIIIPREIVAAAEPNNRDNTKFSDILLEWGIAPYQETENLEYNTVKFRYKCYAWAYVDGEVLSPMDDAIDPQRFINRIFSMTENQLNNMRGSGSVIDEDFVSDKGEAERNMNQSKAIWIRSKGKGVQNVIGSYDGSRTAMVSENMFNVINIMKGSIKETTGVNDAIQGQATGNGNDQLVGVTQLMIESGSLMQEPFYDAITNVFEQCNNSICSRGKRIYADNDREITIAVGDDGARTIRISKDYLPEDFRCFVKRENSDAVLTQTANQQLSTFKQIGMLDSKRVANLWGRSTPDQVANALRAYAMEKEEIRRMSEKDAVAQQQDLQVQASQDQAVAQDQMHEQIARDDIKHLTEIKSEQDKERRKNLGKIAPNNPTAQQMVLKDAQNLQT